MIRAYWLMMLLVVIAVSMPLAMRRVPPNRFYGFRTAKTMSDPRVWYEANERAGVNMIGGALLALGLGEILFWRLAEPRAQLAFPMAALIMLGSVVVSMLELRRM